MSGEDIEEEPERRGKNLQSISKPSTFRSNFSLVKDDKPDVHPPPPPPDSGGGLLLQIVEEEECQVTGVLNPVLFNRRG